MKKYPTILRTKALGNTPEKKLKALIHKWNSYEMMVEKSFNHSVLIVMLLIQKEVNDIFKQYPDLKFELEMDDYDRELYQYLGYKFQYKFPSDMPSPKVLAHHTGINFGKPLILWTED